MYREISSILSLPSLQHWLYFLMQYTAGILFLFSLFLSFVLFLFLSFFRTTAWLTVFELYCSYVVSLFAKLYKLNFIQMEITLIYTNLIKYYFASLMLFTFKVNTQMSSHLTRDNDNNKHILMQKPILRSKILSCPLSVGLETGIVFKMPSSHFSLDITDFPKYCTKYIKLKGSCHSIISQLVINEILYYTESNIFRSF
jgi:hypothetical protein